MLKSFQKSVASLNNSKFILGVTMLLLNVGSRYVELGFSKTQEQALRNGLGREIFIMSDYALNERSSFCILPESMKKIANAVDINNDGTISPAEEEKAMATLRRAEKQKNFQKQAEYVSYMNKF